jgi:hypothetical protein
MANSNDNKVAVNGDTSGWQPDFQDEITAALLQNGGIDRIRATLKQRLDEAGWSEDLRKYCTQLFRSGAAETYPQAMDIVMRRIQSGVADPQGNDDGVPAPNLAIPSEAQHAGADAVRKELAGVIKKE